MVPSLADTIACHCCLVFFHSAIACGTHVPLRPGFVYCALSRHVVLYLVYLCFFRFFRLWCCGLTVQYVFLLCQYSGEVNFINFTPVGAITFLANTFTTTPSPYTYRGALFDFLFFLPYENCDISVALAHLIQIQSG